MSKNVSISKATRDILGSRADLLRKLEKGEIKQRKIARSIMTDVKDRTGLDDVSESSIAVAISRFVRELKGSRDDTMTNYIEKVYFQKYLQSATIKTMDNVSKLSVQYLALEDFSEFMYTYLKKNQLVLPFTIYYADGVELYTNEVEREKIVQNIRQYITNDRIIQKHDLAIVTIQLHRYAESTPGMTTFLTSLVTESGKVQLHDMLVHHGSGNLIYNIVIAGEDLPVVQKIFQKLRSRE